MPVRSVRAPLCACVCVCVCACPCRRVAYWFLSFRLTKPVSHPPSRGGVPPPSAAGLRWIVTKSVRVPLARASVHFVCARMPTRVLAHGRILCGVCRMLRLVCIRKYLCACARVPVCACDATFVCTRARISVTSCVRMLVCYVGFCVCVCVCICDCVCV